MKKKVIYALIVVLVLGTIAAFLAGNERLGVLGTVISGILGFGAAGREPHQSRRRSRLQAGECSDRGDDRRRDRGGDP